MFWRIRSKVVRVEFIIELIMYLKKIAVIVDFSQNPTVSTGDFECIYDIPLPRAATYAYNMVVYGKRAGCFQQQQTTQAKQRKTLNLAQQPKSIQKGMVKNQIQKINKTHQQQPLPVAPTLFANRFSKPFSKLLLTKPVDANRSLPDFLKKH
jgi:hypothetical protein